MDLGEHLIDAVVLLGRIQLPNPITEWNKREWLSMQSSWLIKYEILFAKQNSSIISSKMYWEMFALCKLLEYIGFSPSSSTFFICPILFQWTVVSGMNILNCVHENQIKP